MADLVPLDGAGSRPRSDAGDSEEWIKCCTTLAKGRPLPGDATKKRKRGKQMSYNNNNNNNDKKNAELPGDVILDILLRLPVRSLGRFQCVCKAWRGIIGDQSFIRAHLQRTADELQEAPLSLVIVPLTLKRRKKRWESAWPFRAKFSGDMRLYRWQSNSKSKDEPVEEAAARLLHVPDLSLGSGEELFLGHLAHCDGLVLAPTNVRLFVINPATKDCIGLPGRRAILGHCAGLALDPRTGQYKVARAFNRYFDADNNSYRMGMEVFTVNGGGVWRETELDVSYPLTRCQTAVAINGCLLWRVDESFRRRNYQTLRVLVRFRLLDESFGVLALPDSDSIEPFFLRDDAFTLDVLHGELWLTSPTTAAAGNMVFNIWCTPVRGDLGLHDEDVGQWEHRYSIPVAAPECRPISARGRGSLLFLWSDSHLYTYDPATGELTTEADMDRIRYQGRRTRTWNNLWNYSLLPYTESLLRITT